MLYRQLRPYSRGELFGFYLSIAFTQNAKAHNQFVSVDTDEFKKLADIKYQVEPRLLQSTRGCRRTILPWFPTAETNKHMIH